MGFRVIDPHEIKCKRCSLVVHTFNFKAFYQIPKGVSLPKKMKCQCNRIVVNRLLSKESKNSVIFEDYMFQLYDSVSLWQK